MIAVAVLIVCTGCVYALTITTSTVRTENGEVQSTTSSGESAGSKPRSSSENLSEESDEVMGAGDEGEECAEGECTEEDVSILNSGEVANRCEGNENELIIRFEPEYFGRSDGTFDEPRMEEVALKIHDSIQAVVLSDLVEFGMPGLQLVSLPEEMSLEEGIAYYEVLPEVRFAEPNYQISIYPANGCAKDESIDEITGESIGEAEAVGETPTVEGEKRAAEIQINKIQINSYSYSF